jgi:hypothetical protein
VFFPYFDKIVRVEDIPESFDVEDLADYQPETNHVFVFGSSKIARIAATRNWHPGSFMNDNHDFEVYSKFYGDNLLNYNSIVQKVLDKITWEPGEKKFIRPTKDNKAFTGRVFVDNEWNEIIENSLENVKSRFNVNTMIQINKPIKIFKEIRFWVVDGKIITGSMYKIGDTVLYSDVYEEEAELFAEKMIDTYKPAECFVIDVCETSEGWKIVEINCFNCSGFYRADLQKLLMAVEYKYNDSLLSN